MSAVAPPAFHITLERYILGAKSSSKFLDEEPSACFARCGWSGDSGGRRGGVAPNLVRTTLQMSSLTVELGKISSRIGHKGLQL